MKTITVNGKKYSEESLVQIHDRMVDNILAVLTNLNLRANLDDGLDQANNRMIEQAMAAKDEYNTVLHEFLKSSNE